MEIVLVHKCATTVAFTDAGSKPTGTQYKSRSLKGFGTGEPQLEQKSDRKPVSLIHDFMESLPLTNRRLSLPTIVEEFEVVPLCFLHNEQ
ncbi:hypothetical protein UH38_02145 [Aliterella atlantica CENA595]|uniref:Uncharacterized protein n=1 Tax=Aliterella atlantica CENA595 TaxID=1618023 RepID=A0A0D8ZXT0_9CYAN|nr:hypothetical protein UH38_02145 [Aliterella atlantica CENA595]